jgi:nicotinamidase/pyrazinamidase
MTRDQTMTMTTLLLIDVQKDFHPGGSLAIPTASEDADRIASFITKHAGSINRIVVTLDTHPKWHIAHPTFWVAGESESAAAADGESSQRRHPAPFTVISSEDIRSKKWIPSAPPSSSTTSLSQHAIVDKNILAQGGPIPDNLFTAQEQNENQARSMDLTAYCAEYAHRLESSTSDNRKFSLTIWPEHCIEGSDGHNIVDIVAAAISTWEDGTEEGKRTVEFVRKGMNPYTEMFSAICAEVPVDDKTSFNYDLVDKVSNE